MILHKIKPHTKAWHRERSRGIGASESPALYGVQAGYALSAYTLAKVKRGEMEPPVVDGDLARAGLILEPGIAEIHRERQGWKLAPGHYAVDDHEPRMRCSLDYVIAEPTDIDRRKIGNVDGPGVLQIKAVIGPQWQRQWTDIHPPEHVRIQTQQEIACTGFEWGCVGALVGGMTPVLYWMRADSRFHDGLRRKIDDFWRRFVEGGETPPIDHTESTRLALRVLQPAREFSPGMNDYENDPVLNDLAQDYDSACANFTQAQADKAGAENRLIEHLGMVRLAFSSDWWIERSVSDHRRTLKVTRRYTAQGE